MKIAVVGDTHIGNQVSTRSDNYFDTCLNKLRQIFEANEVVFFLGDIFNTPVIDTGKLFEVCSLFMEYPQVKKYTILGNHDVYNMNENTLFKTSLGMVVLMGLITLIQDSNVEVGGLTFGAMTLNFKDRKPNSADIILGHHFYNLNCSDSYSDEELNELYPKAKLIFLGHDHQHYEPSEKVYRPGSLLRNASTEYNRTRKPVYYQLDTEANSLSKVKVEALDGNQVFIDNVAIKKRERFIENLERTIALCSEKATTESKYSMLEILKEIKTPRRSMEYISQTCKVLGVQLK
jgi:DNA repair exonuclease SbcCD nuclease subunit